jgi:hypothetical protein
MEKVVLALYNPETHNNFIGPGPDIYSAGGRCDQRGIFMNKFFFGSIFCFALLSYGQIPSSTSPPGAYSPHPNPAGMDAPAPADRPPLDVLREDPKLVAKLQSLLPKDTTPLKVCDGFKKLSDCVAAIHAAQNLEIPVEQLKEKMTGKQGVKLDKAIHELKPELNAKAEKKKAEKQAERDMPVSN